MAGQDKSKVSSIIKDTLTDSLSTGAAELLADAPVNGSAQLPENYKTDHDLLGHAYALVNFANKEGIEPTELLAKILASGRLILTEKKTGPTNGPDSKDPTDLTCFDDDLAELVY